MSKTFRSFLFVFSAGIQILHLFSHSVAQDISATVKIDAATPNMVRVEGKFLSGQGANQGRNLSFLRDYAGFSNLGERVSTVSLKAADGLPVKFRRLMAGEYLADGDFVGWSYTLDLTPLKDPSAAAHVSWMNESKGALMLDDILPQSSATTARIKLALPIGWKATSTDYLNSMDQREPSAEELNNLAVTDIGKGVIFLGRDHTRRIVWWGNARIVFNFRDEWHFNIDEGLWAARTIFSEYEKILGPTLSGNYLVGFNKFPNPVGIGNWEADTRGRTITIVSSDAPFKSQSKQRLNEQLRHEMFHLWIPNGVNLSGNYDWFYEGFALYQSLKTGVALNRIRFDDYLDTLSRAYQIDRTQPQKLSLIEASKNRWIGDNNTAVYARGMLVAFLCDLTLLEKSKGKRSVTDLLRQLYERHREPAQEVDGNKAVLELLRSYGELTQIINSNITGSESIDGDTLIKEAGLEVELADKAKTLKVTAKPSGRQKDLLDRLGYNNWRKLSSK